MFENILVVCVGNVCRSPYAEAALRHHFTTKHLSCRASSAGLGALVGEPADVFASSIGQSHGYDLSQHIAKQINEQMIINADLILTMEHEHTKALHKQYPFSTGKVHLLGKWEDEEIHDPYKKPKTAFKHMAQRIDAQLKYWLEKFYP